MKPLVSAVISTYNSEKFIEGKINDLLQQTIFEHIEIIIINSGSQQNEDAIINKYLNKYKNIKYLKTIERETIYKAWNRGIKMATGEYITNANTDDRLRKDTFEIFSNFLSDNPEAALVYGDQYISHIPNQTFEEIKKGRRTFRPQYSRLKLLRGYLAGSQSFWRSSVHFKDDIWFDENYEVTGDYDFICRVAEKYDIKKIPGIFGVYYKSANKENKEDQNIKLTHNEASEVRDKYGRLYIGSLTSGSLNKLQIKLRLLSLMPRVFLGAINKLTFTSLPGFFTIDRIYICWLLSLILERKGKFKQAKELIKSYEYRDASALIKIQLNNLNNSGKK